MKRKMLLSSIFAVLLIAIAFGNTETTQAASTKGPDTSDSSWAHISVASLDESVETTYLYACDNLKKEGIKTGKVSGITYNKKTNTLSLKNFKNSYAFIQINMMGSDFTLKLNGQNELGYVCAYGDSYNGNLTIAGSGSIVLNKKKVNKGIFGCGIFLGAEKSASRLSISKTCTVTSYGCEYETYEQSDSGEYAAVQKQGAPIFIWATKYTSASKALVFNGKVTTGNTIKRSKNASIKKCYDYTMKGTKFICKKTSK